MTEPHKDYKVKANDFVFYFDKTEVANTDIIQQSATAFNCIKDHRSVNVIIEQVDVINKKLQVRVAGELFSVEIKDALDQMLEVMGFGMAINKQLTSIKAPMPGLVLEIAVTDGQAVNKDDKILILEAMKMENVIAIPISATIKKVLVSKGQAVDRGQVLVELET